MSSTYPYPYPSHVFVPSFVTVKLSGREMYGIWKTQMYCLIESHDMLGFINTNSRPESTASGKEKVGDYMLWRRSDSLVKGWILGSLSEQALRYVVSCFKTNTNFTAKDVWDNLRTIYGPPILLQAAASEDLDEKKETIEDTEAKSTLKMNSVSQVATSDKEEKREMNLVSQVATSDEEEKREGIMNEEADEERAETLRKLYEAVLNQRHQDVRFLVRLHKVKVTDIVTVNGDTALHVAVGTTKNKVFLDKILNMAPDSTILDVRNSDGSTLLHVAAIVGNLDAAEILIKMNRELLFAKDNEGHTPLVKAFSNMHTNTYLFLLEQTNSDDREMGTLFDGRSGDELLVNAISSKDFKSARRVLARCGTVHSDAVMMAMAQNFPSEPNIRKKRVIEYLWPSLKLIHVEDPTYADAIDLLKEVCHAIRSSKDSNTHHQYYTIPIFEATRQNAYKIVTEIVAYFPNSIWSVNEDGHNIIQYAVVNRSDKVYNSLYQMSEIQSNIYKTIKDSSGNNLLHLAATLAPTNKLNLISGAALQVQRELQWFKEVKGFVCPLNIIQKNSFEETPQMVFTREHKDLVIEGEKWMKTTAESYTITAALITTIMFAAAITVPGGNNQTTGIPIFTGDIAFIIFAISDAISLFTSVTSLLMFLSILTTRFAEEDFLFNLPTKLIIGLVTLFISTSAMVIAFGATLFLVLGQSNKLILAPIAALTCLPITSFVTLQFPLVADLIITTYGRSIFGKNSNEPFFKYSVYDFQENFMALREKLMVQQMVNQAAAEFLSTFQFSGTAEYRGSPGYECANVV